MPVLTQAEIKRFFEIVNNSKLFDELTELLQITGSLKFVSIQSGTDDAQKIAIPALRGYLGGWNAATNTPSLADGVGVAGDIYDVTVAGTRDFGSGPITFLVGDFVTYINAIWRRYTLVTKTSDIVNDSSDGVSLYQSFIPISSKNFTLHKHTANSDPTKINTLEVNDIIVGYNTFTDFMMAIYLGGDETDFRNPAVYDTFGGFVNEAV